MQHWSVPSWWVPAELFTNDCGPAVRWREDSTSPSVLSASYTMQDTCKMSSASVWFGLTRVVVTINTTVAHFQFESESVRFPPKCLYMPSVCLSLYPLVYPCIHHMYSQYTLMYTPVYITCTHSIPSCIHLCTSHVPTVYPHVYTYVHHMYPQYTFICFPV